jgi:hypothetical protein
MKPNRDLKAATEMNILIVKNPSFERKPAGF